MRIDLVGPVVAAEVFSWITAFVGLLAVIGVFASRYSTPRALKVQGYVFAFLTAAIFACEIPVSQVVRKHGIRLSGTQGGQEASSQAVLAAVEALGVNVEYRHIHFGESRVFPLFVGSELTVVISVR